MSTAAPATVDLVVLNRLSRDLKQAAATLTQREARYLVDAYYALQEYRKSAANQERALAASDEPNQVIEWLKVQTHTLEDSLRKALGQFSQASIVGRWAESVYAIGPVISAGLLANIEIEKAPTVGHIWRFAGVDPTSKWNSGERRPWNASLKTLVYKIGESFVKFSNADEDIYGKIYVKRKAFEWERNLAGQCKEQAAAELAGKTFRENQTKKWYSGKFDPAVVKERLASGAELQTLPEAEEGKGVPMLPPSQIHGRARRYAAKLFLAHWHEAAFFARYHRLPPKPYAIEHLGHAHLVEPPCQQVIEGWSKARKA